MHYTDDWEPYRAVLPPEQPVIGKAHTVAIERDNSNTRHYSARMTRRTKVVSKKIEMIDLSVRIQEYFRAPKNFAKWQKELKCIYI
jgi:insertion element IS1 protein InsB